MTTSPAIGARVLVEARAIFPRRAPAQGTVLGQLRSRMLLIDFGPGFDGHDGFGYSEVIRGTAKHTAKTCWYVMPDYVTEVLETVAAKAPQAKKQGDRILKHLLAGKSITQLEAFGVYRIFRLAARIHELKSKGHKIVTTMHTDETGKPYAEYALVTARRA